MSEKLPSDYHVKGISRAANVLMAHYYNLWANQFPLNLKEFLFVSDPEKKAAEHVLKVCFKNLNIKEHEEKAQAEIQGNLSGLLLSAISASQDPQINLERYELAEPDTEFFEELTSIPDPQMNTEPVFPVLNFEEHSKFLKGQSEGFHFVLKEDQSFRHSKTTTDACFLFLVFAEDIKFLSGWKQVHQFFRDFIPDLSDDPKSFEKSFRRITGFKPNPAK